MEQQPKHYTTYQKLGIEYDLELYGSMEGRYCGIVVALGPDD